MKLKDDVKIKRGLNHIEIVSGGSGKLGKITGSAFPSLIGKNNFNSVGSTILTRLGCVEFEDIDPFYTLRGAIAEELAYDYLNNMYKNYGIDIKMKTFPDRYKGSNGVWYGNDLFKNSTKFGGVIDIGISAPESQRAVVEIKSKSLYNEKGKNNHLKMFPPAMQIDGKLVKQESVEYDNETYQGYHYASLMGLEKLLMVYVFFKPEQEQLMKDYVKAPNFDINGENIKTLTKVFNIDYKKVNIEVSRHNVDLENIKRLQNEAFELLRNTFNTKKIPIGLFSNQDLIDMEPNYV